MVYMTFGFLKGHYTTAIKLYVVWSHVYNSVFTDYDMAFDFLAFPFQHLLNASNLLIINPVAEFHVYLEMSFRALMPFRLDCFRCS